MGKPQPLKRPIQTGIINNREIASKIFDFTNRAGLDGFFILDIFL